MDELFTQEDDRKIGSGLLLFGAIASTLIGLGVLGFYINEVSKSHSMPQNGEILNLTNFGAFGDFIAGVVGTFFALAGFFMLFLTLKDQRDNFHRERLESNFFEMTKIHRDNVNEMQFSYYEKRDTKVIAEKRKVFRIIFSQFEEAWEELDHIFVQSNINDIYEAFYLDKIKLNKSLIHRKDIDFKELAQIDIIYSIIFFGLSEEGRQTIFELFKDRYKQVYLDSIINYCGLKPKRESDYWDKWELISKQNDSKEIFSDIIKLRVDSTFISEKLRSFIIPRSVKREPYTYFYPNEYEKYYGGHQFRLGHYFRHLYQTTNFINEEKNLSFKEKYSYIKILRGQLSNYEQLLLFLNSLSEIGRAWELMDRKHPEIEKSQEEHLITKYNLIKNIPKKIVAGKINVLNYYPEVKYEMFG